MAKKVTKTTATSTEQAATGAAPAKSKASASRPKHLRAQAVGVAAAVEGFVQSLGESAAHMAGMVVEKVEEIAHDLTSSEPIVETTPLTTETAPPVAETAPPIAEVSHAEISALAYRFYLERGGDNGSPADDWFRAEEALRSGHAG